MAGERRINWGTDATDAKYRTGDDDANGRFIVAEDLDGGTVLLEWDESANSGSGGWVSRGAVDLGANDLTTTGTVDAGTVSTGKTTLTGQLRTRAAAYDSDADSGTALSLDLTGLSNPRQYTIILELKGTAGTGSEETLQIRCNNDSTTAYDYVTVNGTTLSETNGATEIAAGYQSQRSYYFIFDLGNPRDGTEIVNLSQRNKPHNYDAIVSSRINLGNPISSIQFATTGTNTAAVGEAVALEGEIV